MTRTEIQRWGDERLRVRAWRGDARTAYVAPVPGRRPVSATAIRLTTDTLRDRGVDRVVTSALTPAEEISFREAGFTERERLHLLRHDLENLTRPTAELRRARRGDRGEILLTDTSAFDGFWQLDEVGLDEAIRATPTARVRVAPSDTGIVGYAVGGRAGTVGYLQRLAVRPSHQGHGLGRSLVMDSLRWMRRRGANHALVNTQMANERAFGLYLALGFRPEPHDLAVLEAELGPSV